MPGRYSALLLSRGEQYQPPPLTPRSYGATSWPVDATVHTVFYDSTGATIVDIPGNVDPVAITFDVAPSTVDAVPAGAQFETFLVTVDGKVKQLRYGQVIRHQAQFFKAPASDTTNYGLQFRDNFYNRTGLVGSKWVPTLGAPTIFDNSDDSTPNGVGPNNIFFTDAAMRYFVPLNSDTVTLNFTLLNPGPGFTGLVVCSNAAMTSYLYVAFESGNVNKIHMGIGSGPIVMADQVTSVNHTVANLDNHKLRYDDLTKKLTLFDADMENELLSWTDDDDVVPHGLGYRYFGASWQASLFSSGVQLTQISAQDGLVAA